MTDNARGARSGLLLGGLILLLGLYLGTHSDFSPHDDPLLTPSAAPAPIATEFQPPSSPRRAHADALDKPATPGQLRTRKGNPAVRSRRGPSREVIEIRPGEGERVSESPPTRNGSRQPARGADKLELNDGRTLVGWIIVDKGDLVVFSWLINPAGKRTTRAFQRNEIRKLTSSAR